MLETCNLGELGTFFKNKILYSNVLIKKDTVIKTLSFSEHVLLEFELVRIYQITWMEEV